MKKLFSSYYYRLFHTKGFWISFGIFGGIGLFTGLFYAFLVNLLNAEYAVMGGAGSLGVSIRALLLNAFYAGNGISSSLFYSSSASSYNAIGVAVLFVVLARVIEDFTSGSVSGLVSSGHARKDVYASLYLGNLSAGAMIYGVYFLCLFLSSLLCPLSGWGFESLGGEFAISISLGLLHYLAWYSLAFFFTMLCPDTRKPICLFIFFFFLIGLPILYAILESALLSQATTNEQYLSLYAALRDYVTPWLPGTQLSVLSSGYGLTMQAEQADFVSGPQNRIYNLIAFLSTDVLCTVPTYFLGRHLFQKRKLR